MDEPKRVRASALFQNVGAGLDFYPGLGLDERDDLDHRGMDVASAKRDGRAQRKAWRPVCARPRIRA